MFIGVLFVGERQVVPEASKGPLSALQAVQQAELEYRGAIAELQKALKQTRVDWSPEVQKTITQGLSEIDRVVEKCKSAAASDPADLAKHKAVLAAYQYKVDLLTELVAQSL